MPKTKNLYWGYSIQHLPRIGAEMFLTKVEIGGCSLGPSLQKEQVVIGPIQEIEQIAPNMSILWTEKEGYVVYWTPRA